MALYFIDTEFIEHATGIELLSIGIVCEDGRTFYAENTAVDYRLADDWVKENVLSKLTNNQDIVINNQGKITESVSKTLPKLHSKNFSYKGDYSQIK